MFPLFFDLSEKHCLVIGGGSVAARRVSTLKQHCNDILVIAEVCSEEIKAMGIKYEERSFLPSDLDNTFFVIAATDNASFNDYICELCNRRNIIANVATPHRNYAVDFPSVITRGTSIIGINSGGNPSLSKYLRIRIENILPENLEQVSVESNYIRQTEKNTHSEDELKNIMSEYIKDKLG